MTKNVDWDVENQIKQTDSRMLMVVSVYLHCVYHLLLPWGETQAYAAYATMNMYDLFSGVSLSIRPPEIGNSYYMTFWLL